MREVSSMLSADILAAGVINGLMAGGIYVLVAVGLTLIYGVLHIINFAHGSLLMLAMYAVFFLSRKPLGLDPYVEGVMAISFGIGIACLGAAACLLMPTFYVSPSSGNAFVLIAFTIVALGGMGSFAGALVGGLIVGIVESVCGLWLGEQLGQI